MLNRVKMYIRIYCKINGKKKKKMATIIHVAQALHFHEKQRWQPLVTLFRHSTSLNNTDGAH